MIVFLLSVNGQGPLLSLGEFLLSDCTWTISICWLLFSMCFLSSSRVSIFFDSSESEDLADGVCGAEAMIPVFNCTQANEYWFEARQ